MVSRCNLQKAPTSMFRSQKLYEFNVPFMLQQWNCVEYHHMQWHHSSTRHTWLLPSQPPWGKTGVKMSQPASPPDLYPTETLRSTRQTLEMWLGAISFCQNCASTSQPHTQRLAGSMRHQAVATTSDQRFWTATVNEFSRNILLWPLLFLVLCVCVQVCRGYISFAFSIYIQT